ncbi:hypothetical protein GS504_01790 [Rhodococcus hoagii]|nr:hypothetical protein [Prescottella equi]NKS72245.1 hypothetical protein [Prescottella equi]
MTRIRFRWGRGILAASMLAASVVAPSLISAPLAQAADGPTGEVSGWWIQNQGYAGAAQNTRKEWMGTYRMPDGTMAWCISFAMLEPIKVGQAGQNYVDGGPVTNKNGDPIPADQQALMSFAAERGQQVLADQSLPENVRNDYAAAVASILHRFTAPAPPFALGDSIPARAVGYDEGWHDSQMPEGARAAKQQILADAAAVPGPWTVKVEPAEQKQTMVGDPAKFTVSVTAANGTPIHGQKVALAGDGVEGLPATVESGQTVQFTGTPTKTDFAITGATLGVPGGLEMKRPDGNMSGRAQNMVVVTKPSVIEGKLTGTAKEYPGVVSVIKARSGDTAKAPIPGAKFEIRDTAGKPVADETGHTIPTVVSAAEAVAVNLAPGDYELVEAAAPEGYILDQKPIRFTVTSRQQTTVVQSNDAKPVVEIVKVIDGDAQETPVAGVKVQIQKLGAGNSSSSSTGPSTSAPVTTTGPTPTSAAAKATTTAGTTTASAAGAGAGAAPDGAPIEITTGTAPHPIALDPGRYEITETAAPAHLALTAKPQIIEVKAGDVKKVVLANEVNANLTKRDRVSGAALAGATYEIRACDTDKVLTTVTSGPDGKAAFTTPAGCWAAVETKAPQGYDLDATPTRFTVTGQSAGEVTVFDTATAQPVVPRNTAARVEVKAIPSGPLTR